MSCDNAVIYEVHIDCATPRPKGIIAAALTRCDYPGGDALYAMRLVGQIRYLGGDRPDLLLLREGQRTQKFDNSAIPDMSISDDQAVPGVIDFSAAINLIGLPPDVVLELLIKRPGEVAAPVACINIKRRPLQVPYEPRFRQLPLQTQGRSGSTWFMRLVSQHPRLLVHNCYPYEFKGAQYYVNMVRTLSEPVERGDRAVNNVLYDSFAHVVPPNPYYHPLHLTERVQRVIGQTFPERLAELSMRAIDDLYAVIWEQQGTRQVAPPLDLPRFFIEKQTSFPALVNELYHHEKLLFLLRDPRDIICSIMAFQAKVGSIFGRPVTFSDRPFVERILGVFCDLCSAYLSQRGRAHLVRYEDLMNEPTKTLTLLFDYLGIDSSTATVEGVLRDANANFPELLSHRTSDAEHPSVGRWRQDMPSETAFWCRGFLDDRTRALGYE